MTRPSCAHCGRPLTPSEIDDDAPGLRGLCAECADLAVYGAACPSCDAIPSPRRPCRS